MIGAIAARVMKRNSIVIDIKGLSHSYGEKKIYENLDLQIKEGSIFGLLGKNGVGKSTLINILMGYLKPKKGECLIFDNHSHDLPSHIKKDIALLHEGFISYDYMSIEQIERYFAPFYPKWKKRLFYDLIDLMGLGYTQKLSTLSFGQKSQVVLGCLFAQDAKLLILDDYSMGLDAGYRKLFIDYLKDYIKETKKTVLITSHVMSDLVNLIDDIAIVQKGGSVHHDTMENFINSFRCYRLEPHEEIAEYLVHRIEKYKDHSRVYSFEKLNFLKEIEIDFEDKFLGFVGKY